MRRELRESTLIQFAKIRAICVRYFCFGVLQRPLNGFNPIRLLRSWGNFNPSTQGSSHARNPGLNDGIPSRFRPEFQTNFVRTELNLSCPYFVRRTETCVAGR